ncbi:MAG: hypothetical protein JNK55_01890 [Rubrivivax sp.]|nr:hypothetical protein [Rubrivivax sp.]
MSFIFQSTRALAMAVLAALLALPATLALARENWRFCANEGQECRVQGTATVRYGAPGNWETRRISNRVFCSNDHFGDPAPNREKRCEVLDSGGGSGWGGSGSGGGDWRFCANEGQECRVQGTANVRYGAPGQWETRRISNRVFCSNEQFGDPAPNREKRCEVQGNSGGGWGGSGSSSGWNDCANEGEICTFRGRAEVRFGDGRKFNTRTARDSIRCDVATFGDPAYGRTKRCQVRGASTGGGGWGGSGDWNDGNRPSYDDERQWAHCANEGDTCTVGKRSRVRFGVDGRFAHREVDQSITCSSEAFGYDPAPGRVKTCAWHY